MVDAERLIAALSEREKLLRQERIASTHAQTLMASMDVLNHSVIPQAGIKRVLELCSKTVRADVMVILSWESDGELKIPVSTHPSVHFDGWRVPPQALSYPRRFTDLKNSALNDVRLSQAGFQSLVSAPVMVPDAPPMAITAFSCQPAHFSRFDTILFQRVAGLLAQSIERFRLGHRNATLARIVNRDTKESSPALMSDPSFDVLSQAYHRAVDWQNEIIDISNDLLGYKFKSVDNAVQRALERTGKLSASDRTYVFRLRYPDRIDNTHEWVAEGIIPVIDELQDLPADTLDEWRSDLERDLPVYIPDVSSLSDDSAVKPILEMQGIKSLLAVPMKQEGKLSGFVGYDSVRSHRTFLPVEIQLLQYISNAISAVLDRAIAEKKSEKAIVGLNKERGRIKATLDAIPDLVIELDVDGRFEDYHAGKGMIPFVPLSEAVGRTPEEILTTELATLTRKIISEVDRLGFSQGNEYVVEVGDGKRHVYEASAAPKGEIKDANEGYVLIVRDITSLRQQQQQIRRLGRIAELTSNLVTVMDAQGYIDWVNPAFERQSGWLRDEVRGKNHHELLRSSSKGPSIVADVGRSAHDGKLVQTELVNRTRSGAKFWVTEDIQPLLDGNGIVEGFVSVQTDITNLRKSHRQELKVRARAMEAATDGIAITDSDGFLVYMNQAYRDMFGISSIEPGVSSHWEKNTTPEEARRFSDSVWPRLKREGTWKGNFKGCRRDGQIIELNVALSLTDGDGMLCIARDITDQIRMEAEQRKLREELQSAQRRETVVQVAAAVAHDLNNLVAVVSTTVFLLENEEIENEQIRIGLERISSAMDAAQDLVRGLTDTARPAAPQTFLDLRKLVVEAVGLLGSERIEAHKVHVEMPDTEMLIWANRTVVLQVLLNLAVNACDASPTSCVRIEAGAEVTCPERTPDVGGLERDATYVFFEVVDTGEGVAPSVRGRLFEPYITTKGDSGTGMGLPIVAGILSDNRGALWFDSEHGLGTVVTVAWPVADVKSNCDIKEIYLDKAEKTLSGQSILIVDDQPHAAALLAEVLETDGATVTAFDNPVEAVNYLMLYGQEIAAVVTDLHMPEIDGVELAKVARLQNPSMPLVLVSADLSSLGNDRSLFHSTFVKPINPCKIIECLRKIVPEVRNDT